MRFKTLAQAHPQLAEFVARETARQEGELQMIASENAASAAVREAMGTVLTNKYAEGYAGKRYYGGCEVIDEVETYAIEKAKTLFGAEYANVQPHSGSSANQAAYFATIKPGDRVLGMSLAHGGHLTHGHKVNFSGMLYEFHSYGVEAATGLIDYDELERLARELRPKLIVSGASAYPRRIDFERIGRVAREVGALHMADIAHYAGLIAAGLYPSPIAHAELVTSTTHKTLRGPRGGLILCRESLGAKVDKAVFPGLQGGPLEHVILAKAVCFAEALTPEFAEYQKNVAANASALADAFLSRGVQMVSGGTDCHLILIDLGEAGVSGKDAERILGDAGITVNKNAIPGDKRPPAVTSGIRVGTPTLTTRGMGRAEMTLVGNWIADLLESGARGGDDSTIAKVRAEVAELCARFPLYESGGHSGGATA